MIAYRLLIIILSPLLIGHITWLAIKNRQLRYFLQRSGLSCHRLPRAALWFHCASVGEVITLMPLLHSLRRQQPEQAFVITTNTVTGARVVRNQDLPLLFHHYLPFDWRFGLRRFLRKNRPAALFVMETEIWPNLFALCHQRKVAVSIINARLSSKTLGAGRWIKSLLRNVLQNVDTIYARSEEDAEKYRALGAPAGHIETTGNLKLTTAMPPATDTDDKGRQNETDMKDRGLPLIQRDYVLLCSTHADEEKQIAAIWRQLRRPELLLIAPRHPERSGTIVRQLARLIPESRISMRSRNQTVDDNTDIFLLDSIGELGFYFQRAKLVIMGGSFVPVGGHNILEPAAHYRAIITGPYMENFHEELELMLENDAIIQLPSLEPLAETLPRLLDDDSERERLENNSRKLRHNIEDVLEAYTQVIETTLSANSMMEKRVSKADI